MKKLFFVFFALVFFSMLTFAQDPPIIVDPFGNPISSATIDAARAAANQAANLAEAKTNLSALTRELSKLQKLNSQAIRLQENYSAYITDKSQGFFRGTANRWFNPWFRHRYGVLERLKQFEVAKGAKRMAKLNDTLIPAARARVNEFKAAQAPGAIRQVLANARTATGNTIKQNWNAFKNSAVGTALSWTAIKGYMSTGWGYTKAAPGKLGGLMWQGTKASGKFVAAHPAAFIALALYNTGKLATYYSTAKWISSPPDVLLNSFSINPESKSADIKYYISVNADKNIRRWNTAQNVYKQSISQEGEGGWWSYVGNASDTLASTVGTDGALWLKDQADKIRVQAGNELVAAQTKAPNELILSCRLVIYKSGDNREGGFRVRDNSFEPIEIFLPSEKCVEGEGLTHQFSLASKYLPSGDYEAVLFVFFDPAVIIASRDIVDGTYDREGWFISNSWWPWADGKRTFEVFRDVWKHSLNQYDGPFLPPAESLEGLEQALNKLGESSESLVYKMTNLGMPSTPVYFSPSEGDAIVDFSKQLEKGDYEIFDAHLGYSRPLTALDLRKGVVSVKKVSDPVEDFSLHGLISIAASDNHLGFLNISPGKYQLTSNIDDYVDLLMFEFEVTSEDYLGGSE